MQPNTLMTPRRRWFQLHLSTALVLMVCAGVFVGLNSRLRTTPLLHNKYLIRPATEDELSHKSEPLWSVSEMDYYGWPFFAVAKGEQFFWLGPDGKGGNINVRVHWQGIAANAAIALGILAVLGILCESLIRRRRREGSHASR